jgi:Ca2+-transporting ATPase
VIIGVMLVLQLLLTYVPFMQSAFHTEDMSLIGWVISAASGMVVLLVTEFDKWLRSRKNI